MKFFYSAATMGYGEGRFWHRYFDFYDFPRVTKTLTLEPITGLPFAVLRYGKTVWNKVGLHNYGFFNWYENNRWGSDNITVSVAAEAEDLIGMFRYIEDSAITAVELNYSCPNHVGFKYTTIPYCDKPVYLKLNHKHNPYQYELERVAGIRLNSVPTRFGGLSGKAAKEKNWKFIERYNREGLNVAGCSIQEYEDIQRLEDIGCTEIGLGSVLLTNPRLVERIGHEFGRNYM